MTAKEKDELVNAMLKAHTPGYPFSLSEALSAIDGRIGMGDAKEVVLELKEKGFVEKYQAASFPEDVRLKVNAGLETFAQRGGFEVEDVMFQAKLQQCLLEVKKLRTEMQPSLYAKIMKVLEPLAPFAGLAADFFRTRQSEPPFKLILLEGEPSFPRAMAKDESRDYC